MEKKQVDKVIRIAVTGPESTGKSWLSEQLARHYSTLYVPEYAREYVDSLDRPYRREDILAIAREQVRREEEAAERTRGYLFCDTDLIVSKIWELYKYGSCEPWLLNEIQKNRYDLYLLCDIDLPWEADPQREYPHKRRFFLDWFRRELEGYAFPYRIISGLKQERLQHAIQAIDSFFKPTALWSPPC